MIKLSQAHYLTVFFLLCFSLLIRLPFVSSGLPYFYDEDEAHHFNRQVQMLQSGDLNPKYFLKPSLNFYLRLPAIASGFLWSVKKEQARSIQDIRTKDPFGIAGYNFTVSHPATLKANRLFSVAIGLLIILSVYYLTLILTRNNFLASIAGLLSSLTPLSLEHSTSIGVNQPTALFCILTILAGTLYYYNPKIRMIVLTAIFAGLSISTKYNALPIVLVPIVCCLIAKPNLWKLSIALVLPWIAFLGASPFILKELPLFLDHLAFEVWHYGVAGHINHQAEPGIQQFLFYLSTLSVFDFGVIPLTLALVGIIYGSQKRNQELLPLIVFLLGYLLLMTSQKANFNRNLLLIIPLLAVLASLGLKQLFVILKSNFTRFAILSLFFIQPIILCIYQIQQAQITDTRTEAFNHLHSASGNQSRLAVAGELWLPKFTKFQEGKEILTRPGTARISLKDNNLVNLFLSGYQEVLVPGYYQRSTLEKIITSPSLIFPGNPKQSRIVKNPEIQLLKFNENEVYRRLDQISLPTLTFETDDQECVPTLTNSEEAWLEKKIYHLNLEKCLDQNTLKLSWKFFSPWMPQKLSLIIPEEFQINFVVDNKEDLIEVNLNPKELNLSKLYLVIENLKSPQELGLSEDNRNLGIKILAKD